MNKNKPIVLIDPYPRTMDILFSKKNFDYLDKNFTLIKVPKKNKNFFYNKYLPLAKYIIGQPDLPTELISKQKILKGIFNVESNLNVTCLTLRSSINAILSYQSTGC